MDPHLDLRRAAPPDAPAIRTLVRDAYAKWVPVIGREPNPMKADYDAAVRDHLIDLLWVNFELVGVLEMIPGIDHLMIENIAVAPPFQGKGYGGLLLDHAEQVARLLGLTEMRLYTNEKWPQNIALYERAGYGITRKEDVGVAIAVHMAKRLEA